LWEFLKITSQQKLRREPPFATGTGQLIYDPTRATRVISENSKIYSIISTMPLGPYGSQPLMAQNLVSHII